MKLPKDINGVTRIQEPPKDHDCNTINNDFVPKPEHVFPSFEFLLLIYFPCFTSTCTHTPHVKAAPEPSSFVKELLAQTLNIWVF